MYSVKPKIQIKPIYIKGDMMTRAVGARGAGGRSPPQFLEEFILFDLKNAVFKVNFKVSPPLFFKA